MRRTTGAMAVAIAGLLLGAAPAREAASAQTSVFRAGVDLVNLGITVTDRHGQFVSDLAADDFEIYEDGQPQVVRFFSTGTAQALDTHLGLMLDVSGSMEDDVAFTRTAAIRFVNTLTEAVDVTLVDFDSEVRLARYTPADYSHLVERIRTRRPRGETALFDAIGVYLDEAGQQDGRKVMLLYTDGGDTHSALRLQELFDLVKASDVTIYCVGASSHLSSVIGEESLLLKHLADLTGGRFFAAPSIKDLDRIYGQVTADIRAQYVVGYQSTNERADGRWRKVEVRLRGSDHKGLQIRTRQGYFAPRKR